MATDNTSQCVVKEEAQVIKNNNTSPPVVDTFLSIFFFRLHVHRFWDVSVLKFAHRRKAYNPLTNVTTQRLWLDGKIKARVFVHFAHTLYGTCIFQREFSASSNYLTCKTRCTAFRFKNLSRRPPRYTDLGVPSVFGYTGVTGTCARGKPVKT